MLNIFNLFLFLLLLWLALMLSSGHISVAYLLLGIASSSLISIASFRLKLIDKNSELLYLSFGFYRHFFWLYVMNFISSLKLIAHMALSKKTIRPLLYAIPVDYKNRFNPALMVSSLNMSAGLFCIGIKDENFYIHAIDEKYFNDFNLFRVKKVLPEVNDDNLV